MTINKALKILEKVSDDVNCNFCPIYGDDLEGKCTVSKDGECPIDEAIEMAKDALKKQRKQEKRGEVGIKHIGSYEYEKV